MKQVPPAGFNMIRLDAETIRVPAEWHLEEDELALLRRAGVVLSRKGQARTLSDLKTHHIHPKGRSCELKKIAGLRQLCTEHHEVESVGDMPFMLR